MFLHVCVILFTGGSPGRENPPGADNPPPQTRPPRTRPPLDQTPPGPDPPVPPGRENTPGRENLPQEAHSSIRSTSGRYASYWNAFLSDWNFTRINIFHRLRSTATFHSVHTAFSFQYFQFPPFITWSKPNRTACCFCYIVCFYTCEPGIYTGLWQ